MGLIEVMASGKWHPSDIISYLYNIINYGLPILVLGGNEHS